MKILKPCPFCGQDPNCYAHDLGYGNGHGYPGKIEFTIACANKDCMVQPKVSANTVGMSAAEARDTVYFAWNTRKGEEENGRQRNDRKRVHKKSQYRRDSKSRNTH